jgi:DNA-binding GntR family transcriptional regulator
MMTEPDDLGPVNLESTASIIARRLRRAIQYGTLPPGSQLTEADLAARFRVSRGPLREAMQRLVQEGLLRSERNRGLFVITLTLDDVRDIYAALILRRDPVRAATRLDEVLREMKDAAARTDYAALSDADLRFHEVLVAESGSPRLIRMHGTLLVESRMCMTALESTYQCPDEVVEEHGAILAGLRSDDTAHLFELIDAHTDDALRRLTPNPTVGGLTPEVADGERRGISDAIARPARRSKRVTRGA